MALVAVTAMTVSSDEYPSSLSSELSTSSLNLGEAREGCLLLGFDDEDDEDDDIKGLMRTAKLLKELDRMVTVIEIWKHN